MKKLFTIAFSLLLGLSVSQAQVSITEAPDFTLTDIHGGEHNLYEYLDAGKYVMIDLFAYWCGPCCNTAPEVKTVFNEYGCNTADLIVIGLEADGTLQQTEAFEVDCGAVDGAPVVSGLDGGASDVVDAYGPLAFPTIILVAPDRTIVEQDIWPFSASIADGVLAGYGIEKAECAVINNVEEASLLNGVMVTPNPFTDRLAIDLQLMESAEVSVELMNTSGALVATFDQGNMAAGKQVIQLEDLEEMPTGVYFVTIKANGAVSKSIKITKF